MVKVTNNAKRTPGNSVVLSRPTKLGGEQRPAGEAIGAPQLTWSEWFWTLPGATKGYDVAVRVSGWTLRGAKVTGRAAAILAGTALVCGVPLWLLLEGDATHEFLNMQSRMLDSPAADSRLSGPLAEGAMKQVSAAADMILFNNN